MMYSQDGNIDMSGDDVPDTAPGTAFDTADVDLTAYNDDDFDINTFDATTFAITDFDIASSEGQGIGPEIGDDNSADMDGAANSDPPMPPLARQEQTANQASTEFGTDDTGCQASTFEQATGCQGIDSGTSSEIASREDLQQGADVPHGQDTSDLLATEKEMLDFDPVHAFAPNMQHILAPPNNSAEAQVSMHGSL